MGRDRCYFARQAPDVEVRGGLIFVIPEGGCEVAMSSATLAAFVVKANRALDELYERRGAGVIPIRAAH